MRNRAGTVIVTLIAAALAIVASQLFSRWHTDQWFTASNPESNSLMPEAVAMFATAMLVFAVAGALWPRVYAQPIVAAAILTVCVGFIGALVAAMALGAIMSGGAGSQRIVPVMVIGGVIAVSVAAFLICLLPSRQNPRTAALAQAAIAAIALVYLLPPWSRIALMRMTPDERHAHAQRAFGPTYDYARRVISGCESFTGSIGGLKSLDISTRRNALMDQPHFTNGYYDFDYAGGNGKGRVTMQVEYLKAMPFRPAQMLGRKLYVYPGYATKWINVECP